MKYIINIYEDYDNTYTLEVYKRHRITRASYNLDRADVLEQTLDFIRQNAGDTFEIIDSDHLKRESDRFNMSGRK